MSKTITGNIVGIPNPVSDWEQTNPNMADYIKNKPKNIVNTINGKTKDVILTAADVGADIDGAASSALSDAKKYTDEKIAKIDTPDVSRQIAEHNTASDAHNDIRIFINELSQKINVFFDSDDQTLDQLSEIVEYIKNNRDLIDGITTSKVNVKDIIDNLATNISTKPLSAAQGVVLKGLIDTINISKLDVSALQDAINDALTQAKDSGDFNGDDGIGVTNTEISNDGELIIYYSNDTNKNLGNVVGAKGDKGDKGDTGNPGVYLGSGDMPDGYNVQIDPNGDCLDGADIYGHFNNTNNPHKTTPEQIGAVPIEDIGIKEEVFRIPLSNLVEHGYYYSYKDEKYVEQDGCSIYHFDCESSDYAPLGKTLRIRTYMYGDMAVEHISGQFENPVAYNNGDANIELNPKSGICEFEITVPIDDYPELMISFCENPYMDAPMVYVPKDSVWEEIKKVQAGTTYELFGAGLGCYRKTEEVTEFFGTASVGMIFGEDGYGYGYMELPPSLQTNWLDLYGIVHINENMWNANGLNLWGRPTDDASQDGSGTWGIEIMAKIDNEDIFEYGIEFDLDICFYIVVPNKGPR